jgi:hypothetical protein
VFKHAREKRYRALIKAGFMSFEAFWLSTIPFSRHPAMELIIRKRRRLQEKRIRESTRKAWSETKCSQVWNLRTRKMYQRRRWIAHSDHPTGQGPKKGEANPFALYRHYESNEEHPMVGDSKPPGTHHKNGENRWTLDRGQILVARARQAWKQNDFARYRAAVAELDAIIADSQGKKQTILTAARNKLPR